MEILNTSVFKKYVSNENKELVLFATLIKTRKCPMQNGFIAEGPILEKARNSKNRQFVIDQFSLMTDQISCSFISRYNLYQVGNFHNFRKIKTALIERFIRSKSLYCKYI